MKLSIPFEYDITFIRKGCRNTESEPAGGSLEIEIEEVDDVRLLHQVGVSASQPSQAFRVFHGPSGERGARVVEHDGRLYAEACIASEMERLLAERAYGVDRSPFHVRSGDAERSNIMYRGGGAVSNRPSVEALRKKHGDFRPGSFHDDAGALIQEDILRRASELFVHDGSVFAPCSEPVLTYGIAERRMPDGGTEQFEALVVREARAGGWSAFRPMYPDYRTRLTFRLDELDRAKEVIGTLGRDCNNVVRIDKVSPEVLRFDGASELTRSARSLIMSLKNEVMDLPPALAMAYAELRDATQAHGKQTSRLVMDRLSEFLAAVVENGFPGAPEAAGFCQDAIDGWVSPEIMAKVSQADAALAIAGLAVANVIQGSRRGASWVSSTAALEDPTEDGEFSATEVLSLFDAERILEGLGAPEALTERPGDVVVGIYRRDHSSVVPCALAILDGPEVSRSIGISGHPVPSHLIALAERHAARVWEARSMLTKDDAVDEADLAALSF